MFQGLLTLKFLWRDQRQPQEPQLCAGGTDREKSECLFRYISEYLKTYVEELLTQIRYGELQSAIDAAGQSLDEAEIMIAGLDMSLDNLRRNDIPELTRCNLEEWLYTRRETMKETLRTLFMFS